MSKRMNAGLLAGLALALTTTAVNAAPDWYQDSSGEVSAGLSAASVMSSRAPVVVTQTSGGSGYVVGRNNCTIDTTGQVVIHDGLYEVCTGVNTSEPLPGGGGNSWSPGVENVLASLTNEVARLTDAVRNINSESDGNSKLGATNINMSRGYCHLANSAVASETASAAAKAGHGFIRVISVYYNKVCRVSYEYI